MPPPDVTLSAAPRISVLMAVYNDEAFLSPAIKSILAQSFRDYEFLIIDDGSTDASPAILEQLRDERVRLSRNERNLGLTRSLAVGLEMARGDYVARMDADDVARPGRLAQQAAFLDQHPEVGIVGSACRLIDADGHYRGIFWVPTNPIYVLWISLLANPFAHPAVMLRRQLFAQHRLNYDQAYRTAQDYELWTRALRHTQGANLRQTLMDCRVRAGITASQRPGQLQAHDTIAARTLHEVLPEFSLTPEQIADLRALMVAGRGARTEIEGRRGRLALLYLDLLAAFASRHAGDPGLKALCHSEAARIVRFFLYPPLPHEAGAVIRRLTGLAPLWSVQLMLDLSSGLARRLQRR